MEKRNTILLTVIAIATLLVAVVGATFAYFTAQVTVADNENKNNNSVDVTTYALTSVEMDNGSKVSSDGIYPGAKLAKDFIIKTTCAGETCQPVYVNLTVTITSDSTSGSNFDFGKHIKYTLYQMKNEGDTLECSNTDNSANGQYSATPSCTVNGSELNDTQDSGNVTKIDEFTTTSTTSAVSNTTKLTIPYSSVSKHYYVVVEYVNEEASAQNTEQGHSFTVTLTAAPATE